ncbi:hypothetical protein CVT25_014793 [Psilocybe cyanescens]|uniref:Uncharacterized protein n=1 Tax=Psilocybe cyanescens TaxID=93625 RepID=A0A409X564_PSICY|nr:hypothetical protein CVT25_014793 [Psilocybe cyanescens]
MHDLQATSPSVQLLFADFAVIPIATGSNFVAFGVGSDAMAARREVFFKSSSDMAAATQDVVAWGTV